MRRHENPAWQRGGRRWAAGAVAPVEQGLKRLAECDQESKVFSNVVSAGEGRMLLASRTTFAADVPVPADGGATDKDATMRKSDGSSTPTAGESDDKAAEI